MDEQRFAGRVGRLDAGTPESDPIGDGGVSPSSLSRPDRVWPPIIPLALLVLLPGGPLWWALSTGEAALGGLPGWVVAIALLMAVMPVATLALTAFGWRADDGVSTRCGVVLVVLAGMVVGAPLAAVAATEVIGSRGSGPDAVDTREWVIGAGDSVNLGWAVPLGLLAAAASAMLGSWAAGRSRAAVVAMAWGAALVGTVGFIVVYGFWSLGTSLSSHTQMSDEVGLIWGLPLVAVPLGIAAAVMGGGVVSDD